MNYKSPDLSRFINTPLKGASVPKKDEIDAADRFTKIRHTEVDDYPDSHTSHLVVGNQYFQLAGVSDTEEGASWHCWMLAKAMLRVERQARLGTPR